MKVGAIRHPKKTKRPPTELEKRYAMLFSVYHPFESYEEIVEKFALWGGDKGHKIVDGYDNVLYAWLPEEDTVLRLYVSPKELYGKTYYRVTDVVECSDWDDVGDDDYY